MGEKLFIFQKTSKKLIFTHCPFPILRKRGSLLKSLYGSISGIFKPYFSATSAAFLPDSVFLLLRTN